MAYEELIAEMGISGSEVIRQAILTLRKQRAAGQQQTYLQEAV
nr:ribbon-helix-helix protein, CopG family [Streptomyces sp. 846.5]